MASRVTNLLAHISRHSKPCIASSKTRTRSAGQIQRLSDSVIGGGQPKFIKKKIRSRSHSQLYSNQHPAPRECAWSAGKVRQGQRTFTSDNSSKDDEELPEQEDEAYYYYESSSKQLNKQSHEDESAKEVPQIHEDDAAIQYELEAARPRESRPAAYDVYQHFVNLYNQKVTRGLSHLQPSNMQPYGTSQTLYEHDYPPGMKKIEIKYPICDDYQEPLKHSSSQSKFSMPSVRDSESGDDIQRRGFSTYKPRILKHSKVNPGYSSGKKMSIFVSRPEFEEKHCKENVNDNIDATSSDLKKCNELIDRQKKLTVQYLDQKSDNGDITHSKATKSPGYSLKSSIPKVTEKKIQTLKTNCKSSKTGAESKLIEESDLAWIEPGIELTSEIRSSLPINILQTNAMPDDVMLFEKNILGPNQRLAVPWPSYSETVTPKSSTKVVFPDTRVSKASSATNDSLPASTEIQKRGIKTDTAFLIHNAAMYYNDCRLRRIFSKKDVVSSLEEKANVFKENWHPNSRLYYQWSKFKRGYSSKSNDDEIVDEDHEVECENISIKKPLLVKKRLPILKASYCPCLEQPQLKSVNLKRLVPKPVKEKPKICSSKWSCKETPRADEGMMVEAKELPVIETKDCPCIPKVLKDTLTLKRPQKVREVKEPPKICKELGSCADTPRADNNLMVTRKSLQTLTAPDCPCPEKPTLKSVKLHRLPPVNIIDPPKVCPDSITTCPERADREIKVEPRELPVLKPQECPCVESFKATKLPKMRRLPKVYIKSVKAKCKPKISTCDVTPRADENLKINPKKLPYMAAKDCPCIPQRKMSELKLRKLKKRFKYVDPKRVCPVDKICEDVVRADDGMKVGPKELPPIESGDCPCLEKKMKEAPPVKRLKAKEVKEPPKICKVVVDCTVSRADEGMRVCRKQLPAYIPAYCPCIERPPMKMHKPLPRLDLDLPEPPKICPSQNATCEDAKRSDDGLVVDSKVLPIYQPKSCPCVEQKPGKDIPLKRLRFKDIPEPKKICPRVTFCEEIPRSDLNDWKYHCEDLEKPHRSSNKSKGEVTTSKRKYTTSANNDIRIENNSISPSVHKFQLEGKTENQSRNISYGTRTYCFHKTLIIIDEQASSNQLRSKIRELRHMSGSNSKSSDFDIREEECFFRRPISTSAAASVRRENLTGNKSHPKSSSWGLTTRSSKVRKNSLKPPKSANSVKRKVKFTDCCNDQSYLQPNKPQVVGPPDFKLTPPMLDKIDPSLEDSCLREKLGIPNEGVSVTCPTTIKKKKFLKKKDFLEELEEMDKYIEEEEEDEEPDEYVKKDDNKKTSSKVVSKVSKEKCTIECEKKCREEQQLKNMSIWERVVNYFKARPDCPPPEEFRRRMLIEKAEKAAAKAGLCLYDPTQFNPTDQETPEIITAKNCRDHCKNSWEESDESGSKKKEMKYDNQKIHKTNPSSIPSKCIGQSRCYSNWKRIVHSMDFQETEDEDQKNKELKAARRLMLAIKKVMAKLQAENRLDKTNPNYDVYKYFSKLSEKELRNFCRSNSDLDFFYGNLDDDTKSSLAASCGFQLGNNVTDFDNMYRPLRDAKGDMDEMRLVEAFGMFCRNTKIPTAYQMRDVSDYEDSEREKTQWMLDELDELLAKNQDQIRKN